MGDWPVVNARSASPECSYAIVTSTHLLHLLQLSPEKFRETCKARGEDENPEMNLVKTMFQKVRPCTRQTKAIFPCSSRQAQVSWKCRHIWGMPQRSHRWVTVRQSTNPNPDIAPCPVRALDVDGVASACQSAGGHRLPRRPVHAAGRIPGVGDRDI